MTWSFALRSPRRRIARTLRELDQAISANLEPTRFLPLVDTCQRALFRDFRAVYGLDGFVRLLTLKLLNLATAKYHFMGRHIRPVSGPIQLMLDPSNSCQLQCPGCVHSGNPAVRNRMDWPGGPIKAETFERFISQHGPRAFGLVFYNYGEPLLNPRTPDMIATANRYFLHTCLSSNLSVQADMEALAKSGLNCLFASLDGATQSTYSFYRRRGELDLCFQNIRRLVEAKRGLGTHLPYIEWKYLTFEHNEHEIDLAIKMAEELGVDEINIATPFAVDWDDPEVKAVSSSKAGRYHFGDGNFKGLLDRYDAYEEVPESVESAFSLTWQGASPTPAEPREPGPTTCRWLYQSVTLDAKGRVLPCCMPPEKSLHRVYGIYPYPDPDPFNSQDMVDSRLAFADRQAFDLAWQGKTEGKLPYCAICKENPELTYTVERDVRRDLAHMDCLESIPRDIIASLTEWPGPGNSQGRS